VRDDTPPGDLGAEQLEATMAWCEALVDRAEPLRAVLGLGDPETWEDVERSPPEPLARRPIVDGLAAPAPVQRLRTDMTAAGAVIGGGAAVVSAAVLAMPVALGVAITLGLGVFGGWVGYSVEDVRCSGCGTALARGATICTGCGGAVGSS
jgi:hypothetical protein